jgi:uncharacterized membrane protein
MLVHFPIALLLVGTIGWIGYRMLENRSDVEWLLLSSRLLLWSGIVAAWGAIYTGELADAEVARTLCDPTVVEEHEELAYIVGYLFTGGAVLDLAVPWLPYARGWGRPLANLLVSMSFLAGAATLGYVGHLGASLVYQQSAGVHQPAPTCEDFE